MQQVLHLSFSPELEGKLGRGEGRVAKLIERKVTPEQAVEELYLAALSRVPTAPERQTAVDYLQKQTDRRRGMEDLLWALLNTREFMFNH